MTPTRIRIAGDADKVGQGFVNLAEANAANAFWRGNALRVEFAVLAAQVIGDIGNIASVSCRVKPSQAVNDTLMSKTIFPVDLNDALTLDDWKAGTDQHGVIEFTGTETNIALGGKARLRVWVVLVATLDDDSVVTLAAGQVNCIEPNDEAGDPPPGYPDPIILPGPQGDDKFTITNDYASVLCPDGTTRYIPLLNSAP